MNWKVLLLIGSLGVAAAAKPAFASFRAAVAASEVRVEPGEFSCIIAGAPFVGGEADFFIMDLDEDPVSLLDRWNSSVNSQPYGAPPAPEEAKWMHAEWFWVRSYEYVDVPPNARTSDPESSLFGGVGTMASAPTTTGEGLTREAEDEAAATGREFGRLFDQINPDKMVPGFVLDGQPHRTWILNVTGFIPDRCKTKQRPAPIGRSGFPVPTLAEIFLYTNVINPDDPDNVRFFRLFKYMRDKMIPWILNHPTRRSATIQSKGGLNVDPTTAVRTILPCLPIIPPEMEAAIARMEAEEAAGHPLPNWTPPAPPATPPCPPGTVKSIMAPPRVSFAPFSHWPWNLGEIGFFWL